MLSVSLTAVKLYRQCQQAYYNRYVRGLSRLDRTTERQLGIVIHDYLGAYYTAMMDGTQSMTAHAAALVTIDQKYAKQLEVDAMGAWERGESDIAADLRTLLDRAIIIAQQYFELRGQQDAEEHEVLVVEGRMVAQLPQDIQSVSVVDLVTRHRPTNRTMVWEHKSVGKVPDHEVRLHDFQTVLYRQLAEKKWKFRASRVVWNYLRTKPPTTPDVLKNGQLSKRKDIDSTWATYLAAIEEHQLDPEQYQDMHGLLEGREYTAFFPRMELPFLANPGLLLSDYTASAFEIDEKRKRWQAGARPVKTFDFHCSRCDYMPLCRTELMGGDLNDVIRLKYHVRRPYSPREEKDVERFEMEPARTDSVDEWEDALASLQE